MFDSILESIQAQIIQQQYVMTIHADEEMADDNLMLADIEQAIFTGSILNVRRIEIQRNGSIGFKAIRWTVMWSKLLLSWECLAKSLSLLSMQSNPEELVVCDVCGGARARIRYISRTYGKGEDLLVIENVSMIKCPDCNTSYLTSPTLKEIERIRQCKNELAIKKTVAVATWLPDTSLKALSP